jgi:hypothetical protein
MADRLACRECSPLSYPRCASKSQSSDSSRILINVFPRVGAGKFGGPRVLERVR